MKKIGMTCVVAAVVLGALSSQASLVIDATPVHIDGKQKGGVGSSQTGYSPVAQVPVSSPVPEASTVVAGAFLLGVLGLGELRRKQIKNS